ncbi:MAG: hypothetical protein ACRDO0_05260 [Nocardioidaceae bacterium]
MVQRELRIIRDDLHCTAVRVIGGDPERLELAATYAVDLGLEVWFSPYPLELTTEEMLALFADCAERAERVRQRGAPVVFVAGAELTLKNKGFVPGDTEAVRLDLLLHPRNRDRLPERVRELSAEVDDFLGKAVPLIRRRFAGQVTYAAIPFEHVDWERFDIIGVDLYRSAEVADQFRDGVRILVAQGKPVAVTEFGISAFRGAGDMGARCMEICEYDETGAPLRLNGEYPRDELGQATYVRELLEVFDDEGVDSAFVFLFALDSFPHRPDGDPRDDLDLVSPGIVKVLDNRNGDTYPDMRWEPKVAFTSLAEYYRGDPRRAGTPATITGPGSPPARV